METIWFALIAVTAAVFVVMDGFDFGAGALHLVVARTDGERREVLAAIGPLWDGNEVWLLATGTSLFLAFPRALGSALSGFYLAIFMVVWSLILRAVAIELRSHVTDAMWRRFWDSTLGVASTLLPILFGAALGNLLRGLPLDREGYFSLPLFTDFRVSPSPGVLDWYTVLVGVFALVALLHHGALFLTWKTDGEVRARSLVAAGRLFPVLALLWIGATFATARVNAALFTTFAERPLAWLCALLALGGFAASWLGRRRGRELAAFLGSAAFVLGLLAATAASVFPVILGSITDPGLSLTAFNSSSSELGLRTGLTWWVFAFPLAVGYFLLLFRIHRGKVRAPAEGEGY
jgi:cytochrome d ubiquinol oxidase subunit II